MTSQLIIGIHVRNNEFGLLTWHFKTLDILPIFSFCCTL